MKDLNDQIRLELKSSNPSGPFSIDNRGLIISKDISDELSKFEGSYLLTITAFDSAGHYTNVDLNINIMSPAAIAKMNSTLDPVLIGGIITGFFLIAIIVIIVLLCIKYKHEKQQYGEKQQVISAFPGGFQREKFEGMILYKQTNKHRECFVLNSVKVPVPGSNPGLNGGLTVTPVKMAIGEKSPRFLEKMKNFVHYPLAGEAPSDAPHLSNDSGKGESEHESLSSHQQIRDNTFSHRYDS